MSDDDLGHDDEGRIVRDNVYGSIEEDVWRRDFTCNASITTSQTLVSGITPTAFEDVERRHLVLIGDPDKRLREDPVRMLRAVRFAGQTRISPSMTPSPRQ